MPTLAADTIAIIILDLVLNSSTALASDTIQTLQHWKSFSVYLDECWV